MLDSNVEKNLKVLLERATCVELEETKEEIETNFVGRVVKTVRNEVHKSIKSHKRKFKLLSSAIIVLAFHVFLVFALLFAHEARSINWCGGVGFLLILTGLTYWSLCYYFVLKPLTGKRLQKALTPVQKKIHDLNALRIWSSRLARIIAFTAVVAFIVTDAYDQPKRLVSAGGVLAVLAFGLAVSKHPDRIKWDQIFWGLIIQFLFGLLVLRWESGREAFNCLGQKVKTFLDFTDAGTGLVYGHLALGFNQTLESGESVLIRDVFFFKALSVIFFFSFVISILYHYGIMMWVIMKLGWLLQVTIGTTAAESMNAAANIFVGMNEAPLLIKPFLKDMTKSELHAVMTGGFATIAGSVMGAFINFGVNPLYLLSASIMAAPAALTMSKLIYPETEKSKTTAKQMESISLKTADSALDAAAQGATQGVMLVGNIAANLIAFLAFMSFLNAIFGWLGTMIGTDSLSFEWLLGKLFIPLAYLTGVDAEEAEDVAVLLGLKTVVNEFVAYQRLTSASMQHLSARSKAIATYALCSFANFSAIGIQLGGIGFMAPERRTDLVKVIWYAFISGSFCGLLNACLAGTLLNEPGYEDISLIVNSTNFLE